MLIRCPNLSQRVPGLLFRVTLYLILCTYYVIQNFMIPGVVLSLAEGFQVAVFGFQVF